MCKANKNCEKRDAIKEINSLYVILYIKSIKLFLLI